MSIRKISKNTFTRIIVLLLLTVPACQDEDEYLTDPDIRSSPADEYPAWSPDGKWIAYYHENRGYPYSTYPDGLYVIDTSGNNRWLLVPGFAATPDWSPEGKWIAFTTGAIYAVNFEGDSFTHLVNVGRFPQWSPDGSKIVYTRSGTQDTVGIWVINLTTLVRNRIGFGASPDWSPDALKFVFSGFPGDTQSESQIWIMDTSGSNRVQLTRNSFITNRDPKWSNDGSTIVWWITYPRVREVWLMNADGSGQHKLTNGKYGSFSPDSRKIVFTDLNLNGTKDVLWIINVDGTNRIQLTY